MIIRPISLRSRGIRTTSSSSRSSKSKRKGGGGGGGDDESPIRLIHVAQGLNSAVSRISDVNRSQISDTPIQCSMSEFKNGSEEPEDPDEHLHHELRVKRIKPFVQDWSAATRGKFWTDDEEEGSDRTRHYSLKQNDDESILIELILKILAFYNSDMTMPKPHTYEPLDDSEAFLEEISDTLETLRPFWKRETTQNPIKTLSSGEIDRLLYS